LDGGADPTAVPDNLRHPAISTVFDDLHADEARRAKQIGSIFAARPARGRRRGANQAHTTQMGYLASPVAGMDAGPPERR